MNRDLDAPHHVLVIDDEETNLTLLQAVLDRYHVTPFDRPSAALEALEAGLQPDLIVCDVTMPGMSGFELHDRVRALPSLRSVPFVYLTAHDAPADRRRGMRLGADDYLTKPYGAAELREAVAARLDRVRVLREEPGTHLKIVSLGGLDVHVGAGRVQWEAKRAAHALLLLIDEGGEATLEAMRRELWWHPPEANQLHVVLSRLRKALGEAFGVETKGDRVRLTLPGEVTWDAARFEEEARTALALGGADALERAARLYTGPFLPAAEGPWQERRRAQMEDRYLELLRASVEAAASDAGRDQAERRLERYLEHGAT